MVWCDDDLEPLEVVLLELYDADCYCCCSEAWRLTNLNSVSM